jgi:hypothetical protein
MRRRIEIIAFETERLIQQSVTTECPVCLFPTEFLTPGQAAVLAQVEPEQIAQWFAEGKTHGAITPDSDYRICRNSLLNFSPPLSRRSLNSVDQTDEE